MRLSKRMKRILEVLREAKNPLTLSQIFVKMQGGKDYERTRCNKVASTLIGSPFSLDDASFSRVTSKTGKTYHPYDYSGVVYASFSRTMRTLWTRDLIRCVGAEKRNRKGWVLNVNKPFLNV